MADKKLQIIPLGGLGEFGMNCMAVRYGDDIIVLDAGMMFPDAELMGVDIVTPDFTYLEENAKHVRGLILTHGHEDHIGGIPFLLAQIKIPVYGTAFTLALVERRLEIILTEIGGAELAAVDAGGDRDRGVPTPSSGGASKSSSRDPGRRRRGLYHTRREPWRGGRHLGARCSQGPAPHRG